MLFNICIMSFNRPSDLAITPEDMVDIWTTKYQRHIDSYSGLPLTNLEEKMRRAGACAINAEKAMEEMIRRGIDPKHLRAVYFVNYRDHMQNEEFFATELSMPNDVMRRDERENESGEQLMAYHVTVVYNPNGFKGDEDLEDSQVFDLTVRKNYFWGLDYSDFIDSTFFDEDSIDQNEQIKGFIFSLEQLKEINRRIIESSEFHEDEMERMADFTTMMNSY